MEPELSAEQVKGSVEKKSPHCLGDGAGPAAHDVDARDQELHRQFWGGREEGGERTIRWIGKVAQHDSC